MKKLLPLLLLMLFSSPALAESGAYRVEIIVFRNLLDNSEPLNVEEFRSFSQFPEMEVSSSPFDLPDDFSVISQKSNRMDDVWRRLRSSKTYRPLIYAAWKQNRTDYYPPMRIHNQQEIDRQLRFPTPMLVADLSAADPLADYQSIFYQLDGTLQLRRSRFLHLFLDMEYRLTSSNATTQADTQTAFFADAESAGTDENNAAHDVFTLKQNRQIRTGRLQYFDTPFLSALVYVTAIREN